MANYKYAFWVFMALFIGCNTQKSGKKVSSDQLDALIGRKLGKEVTLENNFSETFVLAWSKDTKSGTPIIRYGVWVIATGELLYADTAIRGNVKWLDNTSLLVEDYPGIVDGEKKNFKFKIDLNTKVKTPLHEKEEL